LRDASGNKRSGAVRGGGARCDWQPGDPATRRPGDPATARSVISVDYDVDEIQTVGVSN